MEKADKLHMPAMCDRQEFAGDPCRFSERTCLTNKMTVSLHGHIKLELYTND